MNKKQRHRSAKRRRHVSPEELHPSIAAGLTQGVPKEEALSYFPAREATSGVETMRHMSKETYVDGMRVPTPKFVATENPDAVMVEENTGRVMHDAIIIHRKETQFALRAGQICLRCLEPQAQAFPELCDLCGYPMAERQIMDIAMEFEGEKHLGPNKPIQEYLDDQDLRMEKRRFIDKQLEGGGKKIPQEWLRDAHLFPNGVPTELL